MAFRLRRAANSDENAPYTLAVLGLLFSMGFLVFFCSCAGMAPWVAFLFFGLFYIVSIVMTRMRAELGPPTHDFPFVPLGFITNVLGTKRIDNSSLVQLALFKFVDYGHRSSPMPQMLESLYLKDRLNVGQTGLVLGAMLVAIVLGAGVGFIGNLERSYRSIGQTWVGNWAFQELAGQLKHHSGETNPLYIIYMLIGGVIILVLVALSRYFIWWPFHPLGYLLGGEWMLRYLWFSIFIAWLMKWIVLRFGGLDAHRKAVPFFVGIVVGDGVMLSLWNIYGNVFNKWTLGAVYW
jgi:hypothetical protein